MYPGDFWTPSQVMTSRRISVYKNEGKEIRLTPGRINSEIGFQLLLFGCRDIFQFIGQI
jgi:hypothetical protein